MRKKNITRYIALVLVVALLISITSAFGGLTVSYAQTDYYADITAVGGEALLGQLHDLITKTHKKYTSYDNCKTPSIILKTDGGTDGNVMEFYSQANISSKWGGGNLGTWNREHVWCQSLSGGLWGTSGGGSDLHHIRPVESGLNSARGNNKYGELYSREEYKVYYEDSSNKPVALGGYNNKSSKVFEPLDNVKGDVARIVMYMYTHYNTYSNVGGTTNGSGGSFGTLKFTYVVDANTEAEAIAMLLKWNREDPVDDIERNRNDAVFEIQGNRNPFIDNENYADLIWGDAAVLPDLEDIKVSPDDITLNIGQSKQLFVKITPSGADGRVTWTSQDESIATVTASGIVTAKGEGTTFIHATSVVDSDIDDMALVTVEKSSAGDASGGEVRYLTIDASCFEMTAGYNFKTWYSSGCSGFAFIYGGSDSYPVGNYMQFNVSQSSYYLASNIGLAGRITSVTAKINKDSERPWKLLTSSTAYTAVNGAPTNGNDWGTKTVTLEGVTWEVTGNDNYFALVYALNSTKGACYLDSITVEYVVDTGDTPDPNPDPKFSGIEITPESIILDEENADEQSIRDAITVNALYDDGSKKVVTDYEISGFKQGVFTEQDVKISWGETEATVKVKINEKVVIDPEAKLSGLESSFSFVTLEEGSASIEIIKNAITVKAVYADGTKKTITDYEISGFKADIFTEQSIEISWNGVKTTISVIIMKNAVENTNILAFVSAVNNINANDTPYVYYQTITKAIEKYNKLSDEEKADQEVVTSVGSLTAAIADYNSLASDINEQSNVAAEVATNSAATFISLAAVILYIIKHLL